MRATDTLARLGGDEFALVLPGCPLTEARKISRALLDGDRPRRDRPHRRRRAPDLGQRRGRRRSAAPPRATSTASWSRPTSRCTGRRPRRRPRSRSSTSEMRARAGRPGAGRGRAARALAERGELDVLLPADHLARRRLDRRLRGAGALAASGRGMLAPREFIAVAEEHGLIHEIGSLVLRERLPRRSGAGATAGSGGFVSVNVSPRPAHSSGDIVAVVELALAESGVPGAAALPGGDRDLADQRRRDARAAAARSSRSLGRPDRDRRLRRRRRPRSAS